MKAIQLRLSFVVLLLLPLTTVNSQKVDHLIPENGPFSFAIRDYYARVQSILWCKMDIQPLASVMVLPSFEPEWTVYIYHPEFKQVVHIASHSSASSTKDSMAFFRPDTLKYVAVSVVANRSIWYTSMNQVRSKRTGIKPKVSSRPLPTEIAQELCRAFRFQLKEARDPDIPVGGLDGTSYHFSGWHMYAQTWSPEVSSTPGRFVRLVETLRDYTRADDSAAKSLLVTIEAASRDLSK
jgi:hypothetical protein